MGLLPILLSLLAVLLCLLPLRETLVDIASEPASAAAGGGSPGGVMAIGTVRAEFASLLLFLLVIVVVLPLTDLFLAVAVKPLIELLLGFALLTVFYILTTEAPKFALYASVARRSNAVRYTIIIGRVIVPILDIRDLEFQFELFLSAF